MTLVVDRKDNNSIVLFGDLTGYNTGCHGDLEIAFFSAVRFLTLCPRLALWS